MDHKVAVGILTMLLNPIGVPCFMQGKTAVGIIRILLNLIPFAGAVFFIINFIFGLVMGIKILGMSDDAFLASDKKAFLVGVPSGRK